jgi:hypothetical protein
MKKPVPIIDEEAYDGSCRTYKHDDLVKHIIDQIGHPDRHLDAIVHELAGQISRCATAHVTARALLTTILGRLH